jgi:shikimate dehydrogenase
MMAVTGKVIFGIIGGRLTHSLTPKLMNHLAVTLGREERFRPIEMEPGQLPEFADELRECDRVCLNVTSPLKEYIIEHLDDLSGDATDAHAANIIIGGGGALKGYNADIEGFRTQSDMLDEIKSGNEMRSLPPVAMLLGSGGASAAAAVGLVRTWGEGRLVFLARNMERMHNRVEHLRERFHESGVEFIPAQSVDQACEEAFRGDKALALLINTTPIGQWPDAGDDPFKSFGLFDEHLQKFDYYYDVVYNPMVTAGMKRMQSLGCLRASSGVDWFCRQAVRSAELFFGRRPSEDEVRRFVEGELKRA